MEIHITYETLFDLLRKERSLEELQELDKQFWYYVIDYLKERQAFYDKTSTIEQEKMRLQLSNIKRILKEIYERREQKILQLAINVIRTDNVGFVDTRNMLYEEQLLFDESIALLKRYKTEILERVFLHESPTIAKNKHDALLSQTATSSSQTDVLKTTNSAPETKFENIDEHELEESSNALVTTEEHVVENAVRTQTTQTKEGLLRVKFIMAVPKFVGKDKEAFGPYAVGAITSLPEHIAHILLKKEKVEKVVAE